MAVERKVVQQWRPITDAEPLRKVPKNLKEYREREKADTLSLADRNWYLVNMRKLRNQKVEF